MALKGAKTAFESIGFPERRWKETNYETRYHVYANHADRVVVQAETAAEAIMKSGVRNPVKVVRGLSSAEWRLTTIRGGRLVKVEGVAEAERAAAEERRRLSHDGVIHAASLKPRAAVQKAFAPAAELPPAGAGEADEAEVGEGYVES